MAGVWAKDPTDCHGQRQHGVCPTAACPGSPADGGASSPQGHCPTSTPRPCGGMSQLGVRVRQDRLSCGWVLPGDLHQGLVARSGHRRCSASGTLKRLGGRFPGSLRNLLLKSVPHSPEPPASTLQLLPQSKAPTLYSGRRGSSCLFFGLLADGWGPWEDHACPDPGAAVRASVGSRASEPTTACLALVLQGLEDQNECLSQAGGLGGLEQIIQLETAVGWGFHHILASWVPRGGRAPKLWFSVTGLSP